MEGKKKDMAYIDLLYVVFGERICRDIYFSNIAGFSVTWDGNPLLTLDLEIPREYNTQMEDFWWEAEDKTEHEKKNPNFCKMLDSLKNSLCREAQMLAICFCTRRHVNEKNMDELIKFRPDYGFRMSIYVPMMEK